MRIAGNSLRIAYRFAAVLAVLVPTLLCVTAAGYVGLHSGDERAGELYVDHFAAAQQVSLLRLALEDAERTTLQILTLDDGARRRQLLAELAGARSRSVQELLEAVRNLSADDAPEKAAADTVATSWSAIQTILAGGALSSSSVAGASGVENTLTGAFDRAIAAAASINDIEAAQARDAFARGHASYRASVELMLVAGALGLLCATGTVIWLIRSVLPRTLSYSSFAERVGRGDYSSRLTPTGDDELAQLGRVLDDLAERRQVDDRYDRNQRGLIDALQLTESEGEAHELVQRHLERSIPDSSVTVLNRNNSADRLQAMTAVDPDSPLAAGLESAKPRSCLAIRKARPHESQADEDDLLSCGVCGGSSELTTCTPLTVSGEIIGSVLARHRAQLSETGHRAIRDAVTLAAPVLGNLRNLAIAELRAATDSLTGLPNRRALQDTIRRMAAQATRTMRPLTALMCDLDHFKQVNDQFGHGRGDDVLAAVGATLTESMRASDFAGRFGGEEFLVLLPETDAVGAGILAEKIRSAVAALQVPGVERTITLSVGIAVLPDHALDADGLQRAADRALYAAKNAGRDRVEVFSSVQLVRGAATSKDSGGLWS